MADHKSGAPGFALPDMSRFNYSAVTDLLEAQRQQRMVELGFASVLYDRLRKQIKDFEQGLSPGEEVGAYLSSFGTRVLVQIQSVGYHNPYFIVFKGISMEDGRQVRLVQHTSQVSVLFVALKVSEDRKPRRVGFYVEKDTADQTAAGDQG